MSKEIYKKISEFSKQTHLNQKVLDVGCGMRPYEKLFTGRSYVGIDIKSSGRTSEEKKPDFYYDGLNIPFKDKEYDLILCTEVMEHCTNPDILLNEMFRVLKNEGKLFLTVPFIWGEHEAPFDFRRYSSIGIEKAVRNAGFHIIENEKITTGMKAIETLVDSEITNHIRSNKTKINYLYRLKRFLTKHLWICLLRIWGSMYTFDRLYIGTLIIAKKTI